MRKWIPLLLLVLIPACSSSTSVPPPAGEEAPLAVRLAWLAEVFEAGDLTEQEYRSTFTSEYTSNVDFEEFRAVVSEIAARGRGWDLPEYERRETYSATAVIRSADGTGIRVDITVESTIPHLISGLRLQPAESPRLDDPPADLESLGGRLEGLVPLYLFQVLELAGGECRAVHSDGVEGPVPVGTTLAWYVLAAITEAVEAGELAWDDEVEVEEDLKSVPTGILHRQPAGTTLSLREFAELMIAFADNTAFDHLLALVGREAVEESLTRYGMTEPGVNRPFPSTRQITAVKLSPDEELAAAWDGGSPQDRERALAAVADVAAADLPVASFVSPRYPDSVGWFATAADLCRLLGHLVALGPPVSQILAINPGIPPDGDYQVIAFKGAAEPGMVAMTWLIELEGSGRRVVIGSVVDPENAFDRLEATLLLARGRDLAAALP